MSKQWSERVCEEFYRQGQQSDVLSPYVLRHHIRLRPVLIWGGIYSTINSESLNVHMKPPTEICLFWISGWNWRRKATEYNNHSCSCPSKRSCPNLHSIGEPQFWGSTSDFAFLSIYDTQQFDQLLLHPRTKPLAVVGGTGKAMP